MKCSKICKTVREIKKMHVTAITFELNGVLLIDKGKDSSTVLMNALSPIPVYLVNFKETSYLIG